MIVSPRRPPDPSLGLDPLPSRIGMMVEDRPLSPPSDLRLGGGWQGKRQRQG